MRVIGLAGYAGSGKDTVADHLVREHGFKRLAFADALKDLALQVNPKIHNTPLAAWVELDGWDEVKQSSEVRQFLQALGTGVREVLGTDTWVAVIEHAIETDEWHEDFVISDVRYPNEASLVLDYGDIWRVDRPGWGPVNDHASERIDFRVNRHIDNDSTITDLHKKVDKALEEFTW